MNSGRLSHWQNVYREKAENQVSWFQETPGISLELIEAVHPKFDWAVIDIGAGASRLVDVLAREGYRDLTVLDVSENAIAMAKARMDEPAAMVKWIVADVTQWQPARRYDLWHDRAAFHFLIEAADRTAYVERLTGALFPGGHAIIGTFAMDGPERCSGLPVVRYDAALLSTTLGNAFALVETRHHDHRTPMGGVQHFQFSIFRRQ
ncbi:MAG: class I SAM-dependent methyltransferase [Xanthobacteraceae bacterium]